MNKVPETSYQITSNGVIYSGELPKSAVEQFDLYTALLAYWSDKSPKNWSLVKSYIFANTKVVQQTSGLELNPEKDLNFHQIKLLVDKYLEMAANFFTSPQTAE